MISFIQIEASKSFAQLVVVVVLNVVVTLGLRPVAVSGIIDGNIELRLFC